MQGEDTFQYDDMRRIDRKDLALALMLLEGIDGYVSTLPAREMLDCSSLSLHWRLETTDPCLSSLSFSTRRSKSIEAGESRSYSLACARAFCSGVKDL